MFIIYQFPIGNKINNKSEILQSFYKGYQLDLAVGVMFILLPLLFAVLFFITHKNILLKIIQSLILFFLLLYIAISLSDAGLYKEWNAKINMQALAHFKNPSEIIKTVSTKLLLLFAFLLLIFSFPLYFFYKIFLHKILLFDNTFTISKRVYLGTAFFCITTTAGIFTIRGGVTNMPINQSIAYFSNDVLINDITVNPFYNLIQDIDIKSKLPHASIYKLRSNEEAKKFIAPDFFIKKDTTVSILKTNRPNIIYIFLESWSADNISVLGGIEGCTPQFNNLCNEGLLFTKSYGNAYVSDQGIVACLSAYPSAHRLAISNHPAKIHNLPCITDELLPLGYSASFLYGGELVYGNLRGYLLEKKFTELIEVYNLSQYPKGKLGVHDEYTFQELLKVINKKQPPFLQCYFTTSSHMPYDYSASDDWKSTNDDAEKKYTESVHYTDLHLGKFFEEAKIQSWYDSTLFIIVADHSHNTIKQWNPVSAMRQHIPLLITGGALKDEWKGKQLNKIVSQLDIVSTLLHQMKLNANQYPWSRNMLNPYTPSSCYYVFYGGGGYVNDTGFAAANYHNKETIHSNMDDSFLQKTYQAKALSFQQLVYEDVRIRK